MTITIRSSAPGGWTRIPHTLARDPRISNGARGLAVQMLSHADGFRSDEEFLAQHTAEGRDAVRRQLSELRRYGYLVRERVRNPDGKLTTRSVLYDLPQQCELPADSAPTRGKPATRADQGRFAKDETSPHAGNPRHDTTSNKSVKPQAAPSRVLAARRDDQGKQGFAASRADTRESRVQSEDQREDQGKQISQSAQDREAARQLHARFRLTDSESAQVIKEVRRRAARPISNLVPYMASMAEGDLADIVGAVMDATEAAQRAAAAPTRPQPRDRTVAEAIADATPDRQEEPDVVDEKVVSSVMPLRSGVPVCPHGHPGGAVPRPGDGLPSCGPCRAHVIACRRSAATCSTCRAIAVVSPPGALGRSTTHGSIRP